MKSQIATTETITHTATLLWGGSPEMPDKVVSEKLAEAFDCADAALFNLHQELQSLGTEWWSRVYGMRVQCGHLRDNRDIIARSNKKKG